MDLISHTAFAHLIAGKAFDLQIVIGSAIPELDKAYARLKEKTGIESRSFWRELPAISLMSLVAMVLGFLGVAQGMLLHFALELMTEETRPFLPFSAATVNFKLPGTTKFVIGVIIWGLYLLTQTRFFAF